MWTRCEGKVLIGLGIIISDVPSCSIAILLVLLEGGRYHIHFPRGIGVFGSRASLSESSSTFTLVSDETILYFIILTFYIRFFPSIVPWRRRSLQLIEVAIVLIGFSQ